MPDPYRYEGKRVVVTGGASGVGAGLLDLMAELGAAHVTVLDLNEPSGPHSRFIETDLSSHVGVHGALAAIEGPVHVLFNNAGVADTMAPETVIAVNYLALRHLSEELLDRIPPGGAIVNTASIAGMQWSTRLAEISELLAISGWDESLAWYASHDLGTPTYGFSKEIVQVYTMMSARATMARQVRTNSVCPAPIDTPLLPDFRKTQGDAVIEWTITQSSGRAVSPREVAMALAFLGSDAASFVNGVNLDIDAGFSAAMAMGQLDFSALQA
jgi:NAD(P)-dependent dehydrogenase (short-subunit alcohol dehydrogenase family)